MSGKTKKKSNNTKDRRKTLTVVVAAVLVIALAAGFIIPVVAARKNAGEAGEEAKAEGNPIHDSAVDVLNGGDSAEAGTQETDPAKDAEVPSGEKEETADPEGEKDAHEAGSDGASGGGSGGKSGGTSGNETPPSGNQEETTSSETPPAEPPIPTISFPYAIPGTDLVVRQVSPYNGNFIEDGSDAEVSGIAAIVLTNQGGDLDFAGIGISQGERSLAFSASQIPAGATVIIQEQNKAAYAEDFYYSCTATVTASAGLKPEVEGLVIEKHNDGTFDVANVGEETVPEIRVFFKNYLPGEDVYVGGITYSVTLNEVEPQTAVTVTSNHFDAEYSRIVDVKIGG